MSEHSDALVVGCVWLMFSVFLLAVRIRMHYIEERKAIAAMISSGLHKFSIMYSIGENELSHSDHSDDDETPYRP